MTSKTYRGVTILPVTYAESKAAGYRWYIPAVHHTGIRYDEMQSSRYYTLAEAKAAISEQAQIKASIAASER